jgi:hypothetical protein
MTEIVEIAIIASKDKKIKILVPQWLCKELEQKTEKENLSRVIAEALAEELKKVRFRKDLEKSLRKAGLK